MEPTTSSTTPQTKANTRRRTNAKNVVIDFNGLNNFISNSAMQCGGTIYTDNNSTLTFNGTTNFNNIMEAKQPMEVECAWG